MCKGLSKILSNFALHLMKVGKLKRFKKVSSDLKTILKNDLADLRFCGFLSFEKGDRQTRRSKTLCLDMSINLNFVAWENNLK